MVPTATCSNASPKRQIHLKKKILEENCRQIRNFLSIMKMAKTHTMKNNYGNRPKQPDHQAQIKNLEQKKRKLLTPPPKLAMLQPISAIINLKTPQKVENLIVRGALANEKKRKLMRENRTETTPKTTSPDKVLNKQTCRPTRPSPT